MGPILDFGPPLGELAQNWDWMTMPINALWDPISHRVTMGQIWLGHQVAILTFLLGV